MSSRRTPERAPRRAVRAPGTRSRPALKGGTGGGAFEGWTHGRFEAAAAVLTNVLSFTYAADGVLSGFFRANPQLGQRDRAAVADAVFDVLRHRRWLEKLCHEASPRRLLLAVLLKFQGLSTSAVAPLANPDELEWLKEVRGSDASGLTEAERLDLPDWMFHRLADQYGSAELENLGRALQSSAHLDLRVNTIKVSREQALTALAEAGIQAQPTPYAPHGIRLVGKPAINLLPIFKEGGIEVQDEGSQLIAQLVAPRRQDLVVDFCAGAGGKTLALGAAMDSRGRLYAFDVSDRRLANLRPRLKRSGLSNVFPQRIAGTRDAHVKRLAGKADRVLLDVPCSGLGTLRRNPDLKWRTREADITEMAAKQAEILRFAAELLKPGGRLVYATCSLLKEENEDVVRNFLETHPGFQQLDAALVLAQTRVGLDTGEYLRLRPDLHGTDGFFAAVLQRA